MSDYAVIVPEWEPKCLKKKKNSSVVFKVCVAAQIFSVVFGLYLAGLPETGFLFTDHPFWHIYLVWLIKDDF